MSMYRHHVRENKSKVIAVVGATIIDSVLILKW
jgi:hypothetical protein